MQHDTTMTPAPTQDNTLFNADQNGNNSNSPLIIHEDIDGTPFKVTGNEKTGYFLRLGDYRLTDFIHRRQIETNYPWAENTSFKTMIQEYFQEYLMVNQWQIVLTIIAAVQHANGNKNVQLS